MKNSQKIEYMHSSDAYEEARRRQREVAKAIAKTRQELEKAPDGIIRIVTSRNHPQYYLRNNRQDRAGAYISKSDKGVIQKYVQKKYDEKVLKLLTKEFDALEKFLNQTGDIMEEIQCLYSDIHEELKEMITPVDMVEQDYIREWMEKSYEPKSIQEDLVCYMTYNKERVRSKSELNIANALANSGIPYKYECPLKLNNGAIIYPDFTIYDVKNRREIYWEHRGMMDDEEYARHAVMRIKSYISSGHRIGKDLLITEETSTHPLGTNEIEAVIQTIRSM